MCNVINLLQSVGKTREFLRGKNDSRIKDIPFMVGFTHTGVNGR